MKTAITTTLVLLAITGWTSEASGAPQLRNRDKVLRGIHGEPLGSARRPGQALGGSISNPFPPPPVADPLPFGVYEITLKNTGTGWDEEFLIGIPGGQGSGPHPMLVLFHGYGQEPRDLIDLTTYFKDAMDRGWYVLAPLGAHKFNFAIDYAQTNVEKALDWTGMFLNVDPDRIYGVGFSMGGGMATTYASRHHDLGHARFAAVANHTGTVSIRDVYWQASEKALLKSPLMFGGSPDQFPFRYQIASTIDLDMAGVVDQEVDLARNLRHVPVKNFAATFDPNDYLVDQTVAVHDQLLLRGANSILTQSGDSVHKWWTLDEQEVLDFFEPITYQDPSPTPAPVSTLADRDGRWFHFEMLQANAGEFTPFRWTVDPAKNRLYLDQVANLDRISMDPPDLGMDEDDDFQLVFNNTDDIDVDIEILGYPSPPIDVLRLGQSSSSWAYDPVNESVVLTETEGSAYPLWEIIR